jgi:hypothetical protein
MPKTYIAPKGSFSRIKGILESFGADVVSVKGTAGYSVFYDDKIVGHGHTSAHSANKLTIDYTNIESSDEVEYELRRIGLNETGSTKAGGFVSKLLRHFVSKEGS